MTPRRPWALPLVPLYWAGLRTKDALLAGGILRTRQLARPVISIGSLSAGGAGKTPTVIALASLLRTSGLAVDVLSRGYGRHGTSVERVELTEPDSAARFGDEPVLIAASTDLPVWVGADRYGAGLAAEQASSPPGIHLLDDGFQHRRLARTFDVVLLTAEDLADSLLPSGNLREPLSALRRANAVVIRDKDRGAVEPIARRLLRPGTAIWFIHRSLHVPQPSTGQDLLAFSGIARPHGFVDMLKSCGQRVIDAVAFPDHHRYTVHDMRRLAERLKSRNAGAFITTEKDAVKITHELRATLEAAAPMLIAQLRVVFTEPARVLAELEARCR